MVSSERVSSERVSSEWASSERSSLRFSSDHDAMRAAVRDFVEREINPNADRWEADGTFPAHQLFAVAGKLGLFAIEHEQAYGGLGLDHTFTLAACEELGRADCAGIPMALNVQMNMSTPALARHGSEELKQRFLAPAIRGEAVTSIAVTEPDAGSDVASVRTRAVRDGAEWVVNGSKLYITNGTQADWVCLLVRTSDEGGYRGLSLVVVPTDTPGFSVSRKLDKLGNRSSDTAELSFVDMRVPVSNTIGEIGRGFQQQMEQFQLERIGAAYVALGCMRGALERTRAYLRERKAFGRALLANQEIQYELAELWSELDLLRDYCYAAAQARARGEDISHPATVAKLKAGRLQRRIADMCLQYHGGIGYMEETWTARFFRDARLLSIGGGADEVMLRVLSRTYDLDQG
jgi:citronellyl-CoA dehydrogenase